MKTKRSTRNSKWISRPNHNKLMMKLSVFLLRSRAFRTRSTTWRKKSKSLTQRCKKWKTRSHCTSSIRNSSTWSPLPRRTRRPSTRKSARSVKRYYNNSDKPRRVVTAWKTWWPNKIETPRRGSETARSLLSLLPSLPKLEWSVGVSAPTRLARHCQVAAPSVTSIKSLEEQRTQTSLRSTMKCWSAPAVPPF